MRTAMAFVLMFTVAVSAGAQDLACVTISQEEDLDRGDFTILHEWSMEPYPGGPYCVGVGYDGNYVWVSSGVTPNTFYIFDREGNYVDEVPQDGAAGGWGHVDLCFDGTYVYGHDFGAFNNRINAFEPYPSMAYAGCFNGPFVGCIALAYDGYYFYAGGFEEHVYRGHWDGVWGSTPAWEPFSEYAYYGTIGLAYDCTNNCLWMTMADYTGFVYQFGLDGSVIGEYTCLPEYEMQGGCEIVHGGSHGAALAVIQQRDPYDWVTYYDVGSLCPTEERSWGAIKAMFID